MEHFPAAPLCFPYPGQAGSKRGFFQNQGTFPFALRLIVIANKQSIAQRLRFPSSRGICRRLKEGEYTMDDLRFDPSALLIVGMLIGVVCTLL